MVGHLAALEQHVERHHGRAGLEDAVVDDREVRQVGAAERDLVARLDAARDQQVGDLVGGAVDLRVGQPGVARGRPPPDRGTWRRSPRGGRRGTACASTYRAMGRYPWELARFTDRPFSHGCPTVSQAAREDPGGLAQVGADREAGQPPGDGAGAAYTWRPEISPSATDATARGASPRRSAPASPRCRARAALGPDGGALEAGDLEPRAAPRPWSSRATSCRGAARRPGQRGSPTAGGLPLGPVARVAEVVEGHARRTPKSTVVRNRRRVRTAHP